MRILGYKKFIIELHDNSQNYGVLIINEHERKGVLKYYSFKDGDNTEVNDLLGGWIEIAPELSKIAESICEENRVVLWTY